MNGNCGRVDDEQNLYKLLGDCSRLEVREQLDLQSHQKAQNGTDVQYILPAEQYDDPKVIDLHGNGCYSVSWRSMYLYTQKIFLQRHESCKAFSLK